MHLCYINMGNCGGHENFGKKAMSDASVKAYRYSLLLSPVVSVWDCIVRKMRYSFRPEWV
ncbi:hypothetical protein IHE45_01G087000 [Dioscorea alata]|uniref:Uncharacterized protein n=1 Tax=Dioscorea alata TaxID=55571 RepID=A0ACB7WWF1_DIOAL|nr:hypothetical protein IHE45_01G087000 [Dioscorea alata]